MFSALQPVLRQRFLEASRARLIARIERQRGSRVDIPSEFLDLMHLYPQPVRRQPGVEYLPERRRTENPLPPPER